MSLISVQEILPVVISGVTQEGTIDGTMLK